MPEYVMPGKDSDRFASLDDFAKGYVEAAFFTAPDDGRDDMSGMGIEDLSDESLDALITDCAAFREANADDLAALSAADPDYDDAAAGRDLWYTRNGHGVGYWDRGFDGAAGKAAERLTAAAERLGVRDLMIADDGAVCGM